MILEVVFAAISITPAYTNVNRAGGSKIMTNIEQWAPAVEAAIATKQTNLVSGVNIKTINGDSILGNGNLVIESGDPNAVTNVLTNGVSIVANRVADIYAPVKAIASSASVTNAGAVAAAAFSARSKTDMNVYETAWDLSGMRSVCPDLPATAVVETDWMAGARGYVVYVAENPEGSVACIDLSHRYDTKAEADAVTSFTITASLHYPNTIGMTVSKVPIPTSDSLARDSVKADKGTVTNANAPDYDTSKKYAVGDFVTKNAHLYRCKTANTTGAWDATKWDDVTGDLAKTAEGAVATAKAIAASASVTNAGAFAAAKADAAEKYLPLQSGVDRCYMQWESGLLEIYSDDTDVFSIWAVGDIVGTAGDDRLSEKANKATTLSGYGITDAYTKTQSDVRYAPTSTAVTVASHTTQLATLSQSVASKADATTVASLSQSVSAASAKADQANLYSSGIYQYMIGNTNAWFAGTNYVTNADATNRTHFVWETGMDAASVPCSFALWEIRNGQRQQVWDQRDWTAWYWSFKAAQMRAEIAATNAAIRAEIASTNNHAWARYYAATGRKNPDRSTTYVDTPKVCLSPGMNWETVAEVSGCGYWTIVGNGAVIGGSGTNAVLQIKDFEGNEVMTVTKGSHELVWLDKNDFTGQMTDVNGWVCFDMMSDAQPIGYYSTTLESDDFIVETSQNCPAQYSWENLENGKWRVHFLLKPGIVSARCFAKFQAETQGQTTIRYNAGLVISGGLIYNGVKIVPVIPNNASAGTTITWKVAQ